MPNRIGLAVLAVLTPVLAHAQVPVGDASAGYMFAREACAQCHVVTENQPLPYALAVPSFFSIANDPATTVTSLKAFLSTPHNRMPDFVLHQGDVDNVIAYILSLRGHDRQLPPVPPRPQKRPERPKPTGGHFDANQCRVAPAFVSMSLEKKPPQKSAHQCQTPPVNPKIS